MPVVFLFAAAPSCLLCLLFEAAFAATAAAAAAAAAFAAAAFCVFLEAKTSYCVLFLLFSDIFLLYVRLQTEGE